MITEQIKTITVCASISFYKDVIIAKHDLEKRGYQIQAPDLAIKMEQENNYFPTSNLAMSIYSTNPIIQKAKAIKTHFDKIQHSDSILVINNKKHEINGYIGPNVLMEMAIAFHFNKKIFLLRNYPHISPFKDEIEALKPTILNGSLKRLLC